jgi:hypothetical protein
MSLALPAVGLARTLRGIPLRRAHSFANGLERVTINPVAPLVFILVIAVVAFIALAVVVGALAAYIYFCQAHGGRWPGFGVPGSSGGYYSLRCIK